MNFLIDNKIIVILIVIASISIVFYIYSAYNIVNNARSIYYSKSKKYFLCLNYKKPIMAFGSGHKVLRLYNKYYLLLDKNTYGEHPLEVKDWDENNITIIIESSYKENNKYLNYVCRWAKRNESIGKFDIKYIIKTAAKEIKIE